MSRIGCEPYPSSSVYSALGASVPRRAFLCQGSTRSSGLLSADVFVPRCLVRDKSLPGLFHGRDAESPSLPAAVPSRRRQRARISHPPVFVLSSSLRLFPLSAIIDPSLVLPPFPRQPVEHLSDFSSPSSLTRISLKRRDLPHTFRRGTINRLHCEGGAKSFVNLVSIGVSADSFPTG